MEVEPGENFFDVGGFYLHLRWYLLASQDSLEPWWKSIKIGRTIPAQVNISITLMKVVEIEETDHSIHLKFEINLQWRENRVKYQNLKENIARIAKLPNIKSEL